jgi:hypothetical protein
MLNVHFPAKVCLRVTNTHIQKMSFIMYNLYSHLYSLLTYTVFVWWEMNETEACNCDGAGLVKDAYSHESLKYYFHWTYSGDYCLPIEIMDCGSCPPVLYTEQGISFPYHFSVIRFSLVSRRCLSHTLTWITVWGTPILQLTKIIRTNSTR